MTLPRPSSMEGPQLAAVSMKVPGLAPVTSALMSCHPSGSA